MHHFTSKSSPCLHNKYNLTERTKNQKAMANEASNKRMDQNCGK